MKRTIFWSTIAILGSSVAFAQFSPSQIQGQINSNFYTGADTTGPEANSVLNNMNISYLPITSLGLGVNSALQHAINTSGGFATYGGAATIIAGTTPITGCTNGYFIYDNAGVVGCSASSSSIAIGGAITGGATPGDGLYVGSGPVLSQFAYGSNVLTALQSSLNGSGAITATTSPTFVTPNLGTPSAATLTNATGLPAATGISSGALPSGVTVNNGNWSGTVLSVVNGGNGTASPALTAGTNITLSGSWPNYTINSIAGSAVTSVSNSDGTLTVSPTTGAVIASLNLGHPNAWTAAETNTAAAPQITLGANSGSLGEILLNGSTSGSVALEAQAAAGTGTVFALPATNGTNGYFLQTNGSGVTSWQAATASTITVGTTSIASCSTSGYVLYNNGGTLGCEVLAGGGNVSNVGTPTNGQLAQWTGATTIQGITTGTGVVTALGNNAGGTNGFGLLNSSGYLPPAQGGTGVGALGTGVATALGVNVGTAGSFLVNGGALGTPSSGNLSTTTGYPASSLAAGALPSAATINNANWSGTQLAYINGGTGLTALGAANQCLTTNAGVTAMAWAPCASGTVTSVSNSDATLTISPTTGAVVASLALGKANTWTGTQTFNGTSSTQAAILANAAEPATVTGAYISSPINFYFNSQSVYFSNVAQTGNWTVNFAFSSGTSLNSAMSNNQTMTAVVCALQGGTAYYNNVVQIDGTSLTSGNNLFWQGGSAPSAGNINGYDCYTYAITKVGSSSYIVLASQTQF